MENQNLGIKVKIVETGVICRLCMRHNEYSVNVFFTNVVDGKCVWEVIQDLLNIEVAEEDRLPDTACRRCLKKLVEFREFKEMCIASSRELKKMVLDSNVEFDMKEEIVTDEYLSDAEMFSQESPFNGESTDGEVTDDMTLPLKLEDLDREEIEPRESLAEEESNEGDNPVEDYSGVTSVTKIVSVPQPVDDRVDDCSMSGGIPNTSKKIESDVRGEGQEITLNESKINKNVSGVHGGHPMGKSVTFPSEITKRQVKKKSRANEGERDKQHNYQTSNFKFDDMKGYELRSLDSLDKNIMECKEFICDYCEISYVDKNKLCAHIREHISRNRSSMSVMLEDLSMGSSELRVLKNNGFIPFKCEICGKEFKRKRNLQEHCVTHSNLKPFKCETCGKKFKLAGALRQHSAIHNLSKPFKCETCGKEFKWKLSLQSHSVTHSNLKPFKCDTCGKEFKRIGGLRNHSLVHKESKPFICQMCGKGFNRNSNLRVHSVTHSNLKPFKCETCGKEFKLVKDMRKHAIVHDVSKPFICETCGKTFKRKDNLRVHSVTHSDLKPFKCETCGKQFKLVGDLRQHSFIHNVSNPFKCELCGKEFKLEKGLRAHAARHSNLKSFK